MRILMFNPSYPPMPCGIGEYTGALAAELAGRHDVTVVTSTAAAATSDGPARVLPILRDWCLVDYLRAYRRFARPRPDLVVSGYPSVLPGRCARLLYLVPALAKLTLGRPRVTFVVHEFVRTEERARRLLALGLRCADDVVVPTESERAAVVARHPFAAAKTRVVENGSSIGPVADDPDADARTRQEIAGGRALVFFSGRLSSPEKGFEELLEAVAPTGAVLAATGALDPADPLHARLVERIAALGIGDRVRWLGYLEAAAVGRAMRAADVVAVPFRGGAESGYTSLLGALVNGAAVVTTRGPQTPDWLRDADNALLVEPGDAVALGRAIDRLLTDADLARRLRTGARALTPRFGWPRVARELLLAPREAPLGSTPK